MSVSSEGLSGLVSPSDIAELAGVSRGAVSNWRKRLSGFPEPVGGTAAKPLFDRRQILDWLEASGRKVEDDSARVKIWALLNSLRGVVDSRDLPAFVLREAVRGTPAETEFDDATGLDAKAERLIRSAIEAIPTAQRGPAIDYVLERHAKLDVRSGGESGFVGSRTARLLGNLAAAHAPESVYDPACGIGVALLLAAADDSSVVITGDDINAGAVAIARARASLYGLSATFKCGDVLSKDPRPNERFDVVVAEPPWGMRWADGEALADLRFEFGVPPGRSSELAWIQHVVAHLQDGGTGYVLTPRGVLGRRGREESIRAELLQRGCVRAIVGLPSRMLPYTSVPLALWVLQRPTNVAPATVRMVDGSDASDPETDAVAWLSSEDQSGEVPLTDVALAEVLVNECDLEPARWIAPDAPDPAEAREVLGAARATFERSASAVLESIAQVDAIELATRARVTTLAELLDRKVVALVPSVLSRSGRQDEGELELVSAAHVRSGHFPEPDVDSTEESTEPGDVILSPIDTVRAVVDVEGGHRVKAGLHVLRVLDSAAMSPEFLALMLTGGWNDRFQRGTTIRRAALKLLEVPVVDRASQNNITDSIAVIDAVSGDAAELARSGVSLKSAVLSAVRYGGARSVETTADGETP